MFDPASLTEREREVLGQIAIGQDGGHPPAVLTALERKGAIIAYTATLPGRFPVQIKRYELPLPVHIAWCAWCSTQPDADDES